MIAGARRKASFLSAHPWCCFCGGRVAAVEVDHVPSRAIFRDRQWPEGYEFPTCVPCNRATRHDEQVVAMLARIYPDAVDEKGRAEVAERIRAVAHNYPELFAELWPEQRQYRTAATKYGLRKPEGGSYADISVLSLRGPRTIAAVNNFARKLFCALYYMHSSRILPPEGGIAFQWYSNLQIDAEELPRSLAAVLLGFPKLERARTVLEDQFFYRYGLADSGRVASFLAFFNRSFALLGYVRDSANEFELPEDAVVLTPLTPS